MTPVESGAVWRRTILSLTRPRREEQSRLMTVAVATQVALFLLLALAVSLGDREPCQGTPAVKTVRPAALTHAELQRSR
jgi:hypothetical protein